MATKSHCSCRARFSASSASRSSPSTASRRRISATSEAVRLVTVDSSDSRTKISGRFSPAPISTGLPLARPVQACSCHGSWPSGHEDSFHRERKDWPPEWARLIRRKMRKAGYWRNGGTLSSILRCDAAKPADGPRRARGAAETPASAAWTGSPSDSRPPQPRVWWVLCRAGRYLTRPSHSFTPLRPVTHPLRGNDFDAMHHNTFRQRYLTPLLQSSGHRSSPRLCPLFFPMRLARCRAALCWLLRHGRKH